MEPIKFDLRIYQGSTLDVKLIHKDQSKRFRKEPTDLTGLNARMQIRRRFSGEIVYDFRYTDGEIGVGDPTNGEINIFIPAEETSMINIDECQYDIEVYSDDTGFVGKLFYGNIILLREVTYA